MSRARGSEAPAAGPEVMLHKARLARTSGLRAKYAERGLAEGSVDDTTRAMLLRQLYLSHLESRRFEEALRLAEDMVAVGVMPDVARQDAARACLGLQRISTAVKHLRIAGRVSPPSRRAFHSWTLGSVLYLSGDPDGAVAAFSRALRWGTTDRALYRAQLALARVAAGVSAGEDLHALRSTLREAACGQGYGQFVLGELSFQVGDLEAANEHLERFLKRSTSGRVALRIALAGELTRARRLRSRIRRLLKKPTAD